MADTSEAVLKMKPLSGDPHLQYAAWYSSAIESAKRCYGAHFEGGLYALGVTHTEASWRFQYPDTEDANGNIIPGIPKPHPPTRPVHPGPACAANLFTQYAFNVSVFTAYHKALISYDIELHASLGPERIDEIRDPTTGMTNITPADIFDFFRERYSVMTKGKLIQLQDTLLYMGAKSLQGHIAYSVQVHKVLEQNGNGLSELNKQHYLESSLANDKCYQTWVTLYQEKYRTMASRSFAALAQHVLEHDASAPKAEASYAANRLVHQHDGITDDDGSATANYAQGSRGDGGNRSHPGNQRSDHGNRAHDSRLDSIENALQQIMATLALAADTKAASSVPAPVPSLHYCFFHGSKTPHMGNACPEMKKDNKYSPDMLKATKKMHLCDTYGNWMWGAD